MMRKIYTLLFLCFGFMATGQSLKYAQLERCIVNGQPCDSCFRMTASTGYLTKCLTIAQLRTEFGEQGTITANADGTYTYSIGPITFGYTCNIVNDTIIQLRNFQDSVASECVITGLVEALDSAYISEDTVMTFITVGGSIFSIDLCPVVRACETLTELTYDAGDNTLTYLDENGVENELVLGDYIESVMCINDGGYEFTRSNGGMDSLIYRFNKDSVATTGTIYLVNGCGYIADSFSVGGGGIPEMTLDIVNDTFESTNCLIYINTVKLNDTLCSGGPTIYSYVEGTAEGGHVIVDSDGNFIFTFDDCVEANNHGFSVMACCVDGTCDFSDVIITLPACGTSDAIEDQYQGQRGIPIVFNVSANDTACVSPKVTSYSVVTTTHFGSLYFTSNGTGVYYPFPWFTGRDSAYIVLRCDGVECDYAWLKFRIITSNIFDDFFTCVNGSTLTALNSTVNDVACSLPSVTTYDWNGALFPPAAGTVTGTPASHSFAAATNFCGVAMRQYDQSCDGIFANTATTYYYVSCGNAIDDVFDMFDSTKQIRPYDNDNVCTNGGISTWHLATNPTVSGTGLSIGIYECLGDGCPSGVLEPGAIITAWDTMTGIATVKVPGTFTGEVCFKYFLKCKVTNVNGNNIQQTSNVDTACVKLVRLIDAPATLTITNPDSLLPSFLFTMGARCEGSGGVGKQLENGDKVRVTMGTLQGNISVDLIVGGNIKTAGTGYVNDAGSRWANWVVPSITTAAPVLNRTSLFNGVMQFSFRKDSFAKKSNNWGDGNVNAARIGQHITTSLRIITGSCGIGVDSATATVAKCWDYVHFSNSVQEIWEAPTGSCAQPGTQNIYVQWGQMGVTLGMTHTNVHSGNPFPTTQYRCGPTLSYNNVTKFLVGGQTLVTGGNLRYHTCLVACGQTKVDSIMTRNIIAHPALYTSNIQVTADTIFLSAIDRLQTGFHNYLCGGTFLAYGANGGNNNIKRSNIILYQWGWSTYPFNGNPIDTIRTYYNLTPGASPLAGGTFAYFDIPWRSGGRNWPSSPPYPEIPATITEGKYKTFTRIYKEGWAALPYQEHIIYRYSY